MTDVKVEISHEYLSPRTLEVNKCANDCSDARSKHVIHLFVISCPFYPVTSNRFFLGCAGRTVGFRLGDYQWAVGICERMIKELNKSRLVNG